MKILPILMLFVVTAMVSGQDKPDQAAGYSKRLRPGPLADVSVSIPYRQPGSKPEDNRVDSRALRVFRCEPVSGMPWLYLHEPLWSFVEQASPPKDFPSFVRRYLPGDGPGGANLIEVEVELSSRELQELVRRTILESPGEIKFLGDVGVRAEKVQVICMSPLEAVLELTGPGGHRLLGVCEVRTAINWDSRAVLSFVLEAGAEKTLDRMAAEEKVALQPTYTFIGFETGSAERTVNAERTLRLTIRQELDASQEAGTGYVSQDDIGRIERQTVATIRSELRVSHREMLTAQSLSVAAPLMELLVEKNLGPEDFKAMSPEVATALAQRLVPLVKKQIDSSGGNSSTVKATVKEKGSEDTAKMGLAFAYGPIGVDFGVGTKWSERDLEQVEEASGVHFEKSTETGEYVAQTAKLFSLREGWETAEVRSREVTYLTLSTGAEARPSTLVPQTFTATAVKARAGSMVEDVLYHGVPVGTMLPFFGQTLPPGFVWADGKTNFPDDPRIAPHLRGKPVPNMAGNVVAVGPPSAPDAKKTGIGTNQGAGTLSVPAHSASGSVDLPLAGGDLLTYMRSRKMWHLVEGDIEYQGMLLHVDPRTIPKGSSNDERHYQVFEYAGWGGRKSLVYAYDLRDMVTKETRATGNATLGIGKIDIPVTAESLPPHVPCNWIIKVK